MSFGYKSSKPCGACGLYDDNQSEPRFGYTACKEHQSISPVAFAKLRDKYDLAKNEVKR